MSHPVRWPAWLPAVVYLAGAGLQVAVAVSPAGEDSGPALAIALVLLGFPVVLGLLVAWRAGPGPVGPALAWVGAAPAAVFGLEHWGKTSLTTSPWPAADPVFVVQGGAWVWNLAGFVALCLTFPSGLLPGRRWRAAAWSAVAGGVAANVLVSLSFQLGDLDVRAMPLVLLAFAIVLTVLTVAVVSLASRYRRGDEVTRLQLRWLLFGAATVPVLLACGWLAQGLADAPPDIAYTGFLLAILVGVPVAVAVAVLRYDLFDVDRLLGASLSWLLTTVGVAAIFAGLVATAVRLGAQTAVGTTGAAFVVALGLLPLHRQLQQFVGRFVDRQRFVAEAEVQRFVHQVRDGTAEPESTEGVLRQVLGDPELRLLLRPPGSERLLSLTGESVPVPASEAAGRISLRTGEYEVGVLLLGRSSRRRVRRALEVAHQARLPIEVSRLRMGLREALNDVRSSRARLVAAVAEERRRLERDLHDGAQQRIVAVGMRLRSVQRRLDPGGVEYADVDAAVDALEATVAELRRLANGIRPSRLDDGLPAALAGLVADAPLPVRLDLDEAAVGALAMDETDATTLYFAVAEAYANSLKHSAAAAVTIRLCSAASGLLAEVIDDGVGGVDAVPTAIRDRVASVGGVSRVDSPAGAGTRISVELPRARRDR